MASILVVDDDLPSAKLIAALLGRHSVSIASNGREALEMLASRPFDLAITDIFMPEMDGIETILSLRRQNMTLPVIAMSSGGRLGASGSILSAAERLGATRSLSKPIRPDALEAAVEECLALENRPPESPPTLRPETGTDALPAQRTAAPTGGAAIPH